MSASQKLLVNAEGAIDSCNKAIKINPNFAEAHNHLGFALRGKGDVHAAIKCYKEALQIKPNFVEALNNMGTTSTN